jgi:hypothetical protein
MNSINNIAIIKNKRYSWSDSYIKFLDDFKMDAFGEGYYTVIDNYNIVAFFGCREHNIKFNDDYTEYISTRTDDLCIINGKIYYKDITIQFYISDDFCKFFLPFVLYRGCLLEVITKVYNLKFEYVYDFNLLRNDHQTIIIFNIYSINIEKLYILENYISKKILINTEYYENLNVSKYIDFINNKNNFYLLDYNILNINYLKNTNKNINYHFIPLCYSNFLEDYYYSRVTRKKFIEKDIDILFFGSPNDRRNKITDILKNKYNMIIKAGVTGDEGNTEMCNLIERSKIVINVLYYNNNIIFDYYRNSFILSTRTLLITEKSTSKDYIVEDGLLELENNIINVEYDKIIETVDRYINQISEEEYTRLVDKQNNAFKKYKMDCKIIKFFNKIF